MNTPLNQLIRARDSTLYQVLSELDVTNIAADLEKVKTTVQTLQDTINTYDEVIKKVENDMNNVMTNFDTLRTVVDNQSIQLKQLSQKIVDIDGLLTSTRETVLFNEKKFEDEVKRLDKRIDTINPGEVTKEEFDEFFDFVIDHFDNYEGLFKMNSSYEDKLKNSLLIFLEDMKSMANNITYNQSNGGTIYYSSELTRKGFYSGEYDVIAGTSQASKWSANFTTLHDAVKELEVPIIDGNDNTNEEQRFE